MSVATVPMRLIEPEEVLKLLGLKERSSLFLEPYKSYIKAKARGLYSYQEVMGYLEIKRYRHWFMCQIQSLVMYIVDNAKDNKTTITQKLGFAYIANLDHFLEVQTTSIHTAKVAVKCWRHYRSLVRDFDRYMA